MAIQLDKPYYDEVKARFAEAALNGLIASGKWDLADPRYIANDAAMYAQRMMEAMGYVIKPKAKNAKA